MVMVWAPGSLALGWRAEVRLQERLRTSPCDRHLWKPTCGGCPAVPAKASVGSSRAVRPRQPSKVSRRGAGPRCLEPTSVRHCIAPPPWGHDLEPFRHSRYHLCLPPYPYGYIYISFLLSQRCCQNLWKEEYDEDVFDWWRSEKNPVRVRQLLSQHQHSSPGSTFRVVILDEHSASSPSVNILWTLLVTVALQLYFTN